MILVLAEKNPGRLPCRGSFVSDREAVVASDYCRGITQIDRFTNVPVPELVLYCAVKVLLPAVSPLTTNDALACCGLLPRRLNARASVAACVVAPLIANDMKGVIELVLPFMPAVTDTSARVVPAGMVTVTAGPPGSVV
jgi:hypothetical protein